MRGEVSPACLLFALPKNDVCFAGPYQIRPQLNSSDATPRCATYFNALCTNRSRSSSAGPASARPHCSRPRSFPGCVTPASSPSFSGSITPTASCRSSGNSSTLSSPLSHRSLPVLTLQSLVFPHLLKPDIQRSERSVHSILPDFLGSWSLGQWVFRSIYDHQGELYGYTHANDRP
jgi:hypothetical protein